MKRFFDILLGIISLLLFSLPCLLIAIFIKIDSKGPILYWSDRIGANNTSFRMPKFRTMKEGTPAVATHLLKDANSHYTGFGSFLRRTSLDEIPQLYSVLINKMSFVGPRPALFNQYDLIDLRNKNCITNKPGITGWAQVNGRDNLTIEQKVKFDREYLEKKSFLFDLHILWLTILKVIVRDGISH